MSNNFDENHFHKITTNALNALAGIAHNLKLQEWYQQYLSPKGIIFRQFPNFKTLTPAEKKTVGKLHNDIKNSLTQKFKIKQQQLLQNQQKSPTDLTLPHFNFIKGHRHPIYLTLRKMTDILFAMNFDIINGPIIEQEYYNFDSLNTPINHPARNMQDTFYVDSTNLPNNTKGSYLLRTQTSNVQVRALEQYGAPLRAFAPGICLRRDTIDNTHHINFHQIEGIYVDKEASLQNLIDDLNYLISQTFDDKAKIRLRPHYFPFTEPSFEIDIALPDTASTWYEICGCGLIHPNVLHSAKISDQYQGYAFGIGIERIAMIYYQIDDIRHFYNNLVPFISQF